MNDKEVLQELEEKNRELYFNNLDNNLDSCNEVLLITLSNMISLFKQEVTDKILEFRSSNTNKTIIFDAVNNFFDVLDNNIKILLKKRMIFLKRDIKNVSDINYRESLKNKADEIVDYLGQIYNKNVILLIDTLRKDSFYSDRIEDYLKILNYDKFVEKIKEIFKNADNILYNNYVESNDKFQKLNEKTLK